MVVKAVEMTDTKQAPATLEGVGVVAHPVGCQENHLGILFARVNPERIQEVPPDGKDPVAQLLSANFGVGLAKALTR